MMYCGIKRKYANVSVFFVIITSILSFSSNSQQLQQLPDIEPIREIIAGKLEQVDSFHLVYDREEYWSEIKKESTNNQEKIHLTGTGELYRSGSSTRREQVMDIWQMTDNNILQDAHKVGVFHEGLCKEYTEPYSSGVITLSDLNTDEDAFRLLMTGLINNSPILNEPYLEVLRWESVNNRNLLVIGRKNLIMPASETPSGVIRYSMSPEYYLDPNKNYSITKFRRLQTNGTIAVTADIEYQEIEPDNYVPTKIDYQIVELNQLTSSLSITVKNLDINNSISPDLFEFKFPNGTMVRDKIQEISYVVGKNEPDGLKVNQWVNDVLASASETSQNRPDIETSSPQQISSMNSIDNQ